MIKYKEYAPYRIPHKLILMYLVLFGMLLLASCSLIPPVQEMSNARQSLQAAKSAGAEVHDSKGFSEAKALLDLASEKIDSGEYVEARELALRARSIAIKSRQIAVTKK